MLEKGYFSLWHYWSLLWQYSSIRLLYSFEKQNRHTLAAIFDVFEVSVTHWVSGTHACDGFLFKKSDSIFLTQHLLCCLHVIQSLKNQCLENYSLLHSFHSMLLTRMDPKITVATSKYRNIQWSLLRSVRHLLCFMSSIGTKNVAVTFWVVWMCHVLR